MPQCYVIRTKPLLLYSVHEVYICDHACDKEIIGYEHSHGEEVFIEDVNHNFPCNTFNTESIHYVRKPGTPNEQFR